MRRCSGIGNAHPEEDQLWLDKWIKAEFTCEIYDNFVVRIIYG
jgi:hypothetical protein